MDYLWKKVAERLPPVAASLLSVMISVIAGLVLAVALHYALYRFGLPSKPFIYVAF